MCRRIKQSAFTLIEVSIVLVIIGLIIGGVLVGKDLIRTSELHSVISQEQSFVAATNSFKLKYQCLPGDCSSAISLGLGGFYSGSNDNGNGDGIVGNGQVGSNVAVRAEANTFFPHLAAANLIKASVNTSAGTPPGAAIGTYASSAWLASTSGGNNYLLVAATTYPSDSCGSIWMDYRLFPPEDAKNIDVKIDDGEAYTGKVLAGGCVSGNSGAWLINSPISGSAGALNDCITSGQTSYRLSNKTKVCTLLFRL